RRRGLQVVCLQHRGAAKEREGRFGHSREANRQQIGEAVLVRLFDQGQWIAVTDAEGRVGMAPAGTGLAARPALLPASLAQGRSCFGLRSTFAGWLSVGVFAVLILGFHGLAPGQPWLNRPTPGACYIAR